MSSRKNILERIKKNQPSYVPPPVFNFSAADQDTVGAFIQVLKNIGGDLIQVNSGKAVVKELKRKFPEVNRMVSVVQSHKGTWEVLSSRERPHDLEDVDVAVIEGRLAVAENGAIWITEEDVIERVLPFICQHLVIILDKNNIVPLMHDAYDRIGMMDYGFGTFVAGPSKTADIEQSLVMGAHGPRSLTVFLLG